MVVGRCRLHSISRRRRTRRAGAGGWGRRRVDQHRVRSGLVWKASSTGFLQITRVTSGLVLASLLTPHQYGIAGMVTVFASLVLVFSDLSLGAALVQRKTLTERRPLDRLLESAGVGLALDAVGIALAGPLASFYRQPQVQPLFVAVSLSFVVAAIAVTQAALLTRDMNFRTLELRQMAARSSARRSRSPWRERRRPVGDHRAAARARLRLDDAAVVRLALAAVVHLLAAEPPRPRRLRGNVFGARLSSTSAATPTTS